MSPTYDGTLKASLWESTASPSPSYRWNPASSLLSVRSPYAILPQDEQAENLQALHFGELEVIAYSYRPGQTTQAHASWVGFVGSDWSYWPAFVGGYDSTRDNVLRTGEILNFETLSGQSPLALDETYRQEVGEFKVDFLEVMFYRMGVVMDSNYFGMGGGTSDAASHPLRKYNDLSGFDDIYTMAQFEEPGADVCQPDQTMNILFASNQWFSSPVRIWMNTSWDAASSRNVYSIGASSSSLTSTQSDIILSLVNQGTTRRFYSCFVVIPFQGPVVYDLSEADPEIRVQLQVQGAVDPASVFDASNPTILFNTDNDGIPFHLSVDFGD